MAVAVASGAAQAQKVPSEFSTALVIQPLSWMFVQMASGRGPVFTMPILYPALGRPVAGSWVRIVAGVGLTVDVNL